MKPYTLLLLSALACAPGETPAVMTEADKALLEQVRAKESEKAQLLANPDRFIDPGKWQGHDKGIFNRYTKATSIDFKNNSHFDVEDIEGQITYKDTTGNTLATVQFKATGRLRACEETTLTVVAGEISGKATKAIIRVEKLRILGG